MRALKSLSELGLLNGLIVAASVHLHRKAVWYIRYWELLSASRENSFCADYTLNINKLNVTVNPGARQQFSIRLDWMSGFSIVKARGPETQSVT